MGAHTSGENPKHTGCSGRGEGINIDAVHPAPCHPHSHLRRTPGYSAAPPPHFIWMLVYYMVIGIRYVFYGVYSYPRKPISRRPGQPPPSNLPVAEAKLPQVVQRRSAPPATVARPGLVYLAMWSGRG